MAYSLGRTRSPECYRAGPCHSYSTGAVCICKNKSLLIMFNIQKIKYSSNRASLYLLFPFPRNENYVCTSEPTDLYDVSERNSVHLQHI